VDYRDICPADWAVGLVWQGGTAARAAAHQAPWGLPAVSIAIGLHLRDCVVLASDTRITYRHDGETVRVEDRQIKIFRTPFGLITGTGFAPLLDAVNGHIASIGVESTGQLIATAKQAREAIVADRRWESDSLERDLEYTGWTISYLADPRRERAYDDDGFMRLATFHPTIAADGVALWKPGQVVMMMSDEPASADLVDEAHEHLKKHVVRFDAANPGNFQDVITRVTGAIQDVIREFSYRCETVSREFQIGAHVFPLFLGISEITNGDTLNLPMRDEAEETE
jgi:hypothetical protein